MNINDENALGAGVSRRKFLSRAMAATGAACSLASLRSLASDEPAATAKPAEFTRKIKLGVVGCGGRGSWIANLFKQHGGYEVMALADYFQETVDKCGDALGVEREKRFATLSGYQKLMKSGVEAVALIVPPYFFPEHARAAVEAGLHVYMAKPVAVDVPGVRQVQAAAEQAKRNKKCFLVDYQLPTDPANLEVLKRIRAPGFGRIVRFSTAGLCGGFRDTPRTGNMESRLQKLVWINDIAMGCDYIGNYDIHAIDAALWVAGSRPVSASGASSICREQPAGDSRDVCTVVYAYADGTVHDHAGVALKDYNKDTLSCKVWGLTGNALVTYYGQAQFRSIDDSYTADVGKIYDEGAARNIAAFYRNVTEGNHENVTVARALDSALTCILGREAAARREVVTMEQLIRENKKLEVDLSGLKG